MTEARALARFQLRRFVRSLDWLMFTVLVFYAAMVGYVLELSLVAVGLSVVTVFLLLRKSPKWGDTGFSSVPAYLISRPIPRTTVYKGSAAADLAWAVGILLAFGLGYWWKSVQPVDPSELVCEANGIFVPGPSLIWFFVLGTLCATVLSDALTPFAKISRSQRTLADSIFLTVVWSVYIGIGVVYLLLVFKVIASPSAYPPVALWVAVGVTAFLILHAPRMWTRYDFGAGRGQARVWTRGFKRSTSHETTSPNRKHSRGGLHTLLTPLLIYPTLVWLPFALVPWLPPILADRPPTLPVGAFGAFCIVFPTLMLSAYAYGFHARGPFVAYVLSRSATRGRLTRFNSLAFGTGGLVAISLLAALHAYAGGGFGAGTLLLPWAWLLFLCSGTLALAANLSSPAFRSPLGLAVLCSLTGAIAVALILGEYGETWPPPATSIASTAAALIFAAATIAAAERHLRTADIG